MNDKVKDRHPDKKDKVKIKDTAGFTLRRAILSGTAGVAGAFTALAAANKTFQKELKKAKKPKKKLEK